MQKPALQPSPSSPGVPSERVSLCDLGDLLIRARKQQGVTQVELADRIGSHQNSIARWEGKRYQQTDLQTIQTIAGALGLDLWVSASLCEPFPQQT